MYTVLIVDDSASAREIIKILIQKKCKVLKDNELNIIEAGSATEARKILEKIAPDLLLLDIILPEGEKEGIAILREVRQQHPHTKVYIMSQMIKEEWVEECTELGILGYLEKKVDSQKIGEIIQEHAIQK